MFRALLPVLAVAMAAPQAAVADDVPACGGVTAVATSCTFGYAGGQIAYQVQNVRVLVTGVLRDDSVTIDVYNLTQQRRLAGCSATTIAAGCGALRDGAGSVAGDLLQCVARGQGASATVYACASHPVS